MPKKPTDTKIIRLPKVSASVTGTLMEARAVSCERAWSKVIVIGESKSGHGSFYTSSMSVSEAVALLERIKFDLLAGSQA